MTVTKQTYQVTKKALLSQPLSFHCYEKDKLLHHKLGMSDTPGSMQSMRLRNQNSSGTCDTSIDNQSCCDCVVPKHLKRLQCNSGEVLCSSITLTVLWPGFNSPIQPTKAKLASYREAENSLRFETDLKWVKLFHFMTLNNFKIDFW